MKKRESGDATLRRRGVHIYKTGEGWFLRHPPSISPLASVFELEDRPLGPFLSALDANNAARLTYGLKQKPKVKTPAQKRRQAEFDELSFRKLYEMDK